MERGKGNRHDEVIEDGRESDEDNEASIRDVMSDEDLAGVRSFFFPLRGNVKKKTRKRTEKERMVNKKINSRNEEKRTGKNLSQTKRTKQTSSSEAIRVCIKDHEIAKDIQGTEMTKRDMREHSQKREYPIDPLVVEEIAIRNMESCEDDDAICGAEVDSCVIKFDKCRKVNELQGLIASNKAPLNKLDDNFGRENLKGGTLKAQGTDFRLANRKSPESSLSEDLNDFLSHDEGGFPTRDSISSNSWRKDTITYEDEVRNGKLSKNMSDCIEGTRLEAEERQSYVMFVEGAASNDKIVMEPKVEQKVTLTSALPTSDIDELTNEYAKRVANFKAKTETMRRRCKISEKERRDVEEKLVRVQAEHQNLRKNFEKAVTENEKLKKDLEKHLNGCTLVKEDSINKGRRGTMATKNSARSAILKIKKEKVSFNREAEILDKNALDETSKPDGTLSCSFCVSRREDILRLESKSKMLYERLPRLEAIYLSLLNVAKVAVERESKLKEDYNQLKKSLFVSGLHSEGITNHMTHGNLAGFLNVKQNDVEGKLRLMQNEHQSLRRSFEEAIKENEKFKNDLEEHLKGCVLVKDESRDVALPKMRKAGVLFNFEIKQSKTLNDRIAFGATSKGHREPPCLHCISKREDIVRLEAENNVLYERLPQLEEIYSSLLKVAKVAVERGSKLKEDYNELKASLASFGSFTWNIEDQGRMNDRNKNNKTENDASCNLLQKSNKHFCSKTSRRFPRKPSYRKIKSSSCFNSIEVFGLFSKYTDILNEVHDFENFVQTTARNEIEKIKLFVEELKEYRQSSSMKNMTNDDSIQQGNKLQQGKNFENGFKDNIEMKNMTFKDSIERTNMTNDGSIQRENELQQRKNFENSFKDSIEVKNMTFKDSIERTNMTNDGSIQRENELQQRKNFENSFKDSIEMTNMTNDDSIQHESKFQQGKNFENGFKDSIEITNMTNDGSIQRENELQQRKNFENSFKDSIEMTNMTNDGGIQRKHELQQRKTFENGFKDSIEMSSSIELKKLSTRLKEAHQNEERAVKLIQKLKAQLKLEISKNQRFPDYTKLGDKDNVPSKVDFEENYVGRFESDDPHLSPDNTKCKLASFEHEVWSEDESDQKYSENWQLMENAVEASCRTRMFCNSQRRGHQIPGSIIKEKPEFTRVDDDIQSENPHRKLRSYYPFFHKSSDLYTSTVASDQNLRPLTSFDNQRNVSNFKTIFVKSNESSEEESWVDGQLHEGITSLHRGEIAQSNGSSKEELWNDEHLNKGITSLNHKRVVQYNKISDKKPRNDSQLEAGIISLHHRRVAQSNVSSGEESQTYTYLNKRVTSLHPVRRVAQYNENSEEESLNDKRTASLCHESSIQCNNSNGKRSNNDSHFDRGKTSLHPVRRVSQSNESSEEESWNDKRTALLYHESGAQCNKRNGKNSSNDSHFDTSKTSLHPVRRVSQSNESSEEESWNDKRTASLCHESGVQCNKRNGKNYSNDSHFDTSKTSLHPVRKVSQSNESSEEESWSDERLDTGLMLLRPGRGSRCNKSNKEKSQNDDNLTAGIISLRHRRVSHSNNENYQEDVSWNGGHIDTAESHSEEQRSDTEHDVPCSQKARLQKKVKQYDGENGDSERNKYSYDNSCETSSGPVTVQNRTSSNGRNFHVLELMDKNDDEISVGEYAIAGKKHSLRRLRSNLSLSSLIKKQHKESSDLQAAMVNKSRTIVHSMNRFRKSKSGSQTNLVKIGSSGMRRKNKYRKIDSAKKKTAILQVSKLLPKISKKLESKKSKRAENGSETLPENLETVGNRKEGDDKWKHNTIKRIDKGFIDNAELICEDVQDVTNIKKTLSSIFDNNYEPTNGRVEDVSNSGKHKEAKKCPSLVKSCENLDSLEEHRRFVGKLGNSSSVYDGKGYKSNYEGVKENENAMVALPCNGSDDEMEIKDKEGDRLKQDLEGILKIAASKQEVGPDTWSPSISNSFPIASEINVSSKGSIRRRPSIRRWIITKMKDIGRSYNKENDLDYSENASARENNDQDIMEGRNNWKNNDLERIKDKKERKTEIKCAKKIAKLEKKKKKLEEKSKSKELREREKMREVERKLETKKEEQGSFRAEKNAQGPRMDEKLKSKPASNRFIKNLIKARLHQKSMKEEKRKLEKKMKRNKAGRKHAECILKGKENRFEKQEVGYTADSGDPLLSMQIPNEVDMMKENSNWKKQDNETQLETVKGSEKKSIEEYVVKDSPKNKEMDENENKTDAGKQEDYLKGSNKAMDNIGKSSAMRILVAWDDSPNVNEQNDEGDSKEKVIFHIKDNNDSQPERVHQPINELAHDSSHRAQQTHEPSVGQGIEVDQCIGNGEKIEEISIRTTANIESNEGGFKSMMAHVANNVNISKTAEIIEIDTGENDFKEEDTKRPLEKTVEIIEAEGHCNSNTHCFQNGYSESDLEFEYTEKSATTRKIVRTKPQIHRKPGSFQNSYNNNICGGFTDNIFVDGQDMMSIVSSSVEAELGYSVSGQCQESVYEVSRRSCDESNKCNARSFLNVNNLSAEIKHAKKINGMRGGFSDHNGKYCKLDAKEDTLAQNLPNSSDLDTEKDLCAAFSDAETQQIEDGEQNRKTEIPCTKNSQFAEDENVDNNKQMIIANELDDSASLPSYSDWRENESGTQEKRYGENIDEEKPEVIRGKMSPSDKVVFAFPNSKKWLNRERRRNRNETNSMQDGANREELNCHLTASESSLEDILRWINSEPTAAKVHKDVNQNSEFYTEREQKLIEEVIGLRRENEILKTSSREQSDNDALMFFDLERTESTSKIYSISGARSQELSELKERARIEIERVKKETQEAKAIAEEANMSKEIMKDNLEESQREVERMKIEMKNRIEEQKIYYEKRIEEAEKDHKTFEIKEATAQELEELKERLSAMKAKVRGHDGSEYEQKFENYKNRNNQNESRICRLLMSSSTIGEGIQSLDTMNSGVLGSLSSKQLGDIAAASMNSAGSDEVVYFGLGDKLKASEETIIELRKENERLKHELERYESNIRLEKYKEELRNLMEMTMISEPETSGGADSTERPAISDTLGKIPSKQIKELRTDTGKIENATVNETNDIALVKNDIYQSYNVVRSRKDYKVQSQCTSFRAMTSDGEEQKEGNSIEEQLYIIKSEKQPEVSQHNAHRSQHRKCPTNQSRSCEEIGAELKENPKAANASSYNASKFDLPDMSDLKLNRSEYDNFDDKNSETTSIQQAITGDSCPFSPVSSAISRHESTIMNGKERDDNKEHPTGLPEESETTRHHHVTKGKKSKKRIKQFTSFLLTPSEKNVKLEPYFGHLTPLPSIGKE